MDISVSHRGETIVVMVDGRLDSTTSAQLELWVEENLSPPDGDVVMDFSRLDYISSAGLRVMLNLSKLIAGHSRKFFVAGAQDHVREVFEISGFDSFIPLCDSVEEAVSG